MRRRLCPDSIDLAGTCPTPLIRQGVSRWHSFRAAEARAISPSGRLVRRVRGHLRPHGAADEHGVRGHGLHARPDSSTST